MNYLLSAFLTLSALLAQTEDRPLSLTDRGWDLQGARTTVAREGDRDVLSVETGFAYRRDVRLQDGAIDFDVMLTTRRSFVYVQFRMESLRAVLTPQR